MKGVDKKNDPKVLGFEEESSSDEDVSNVCMSMIYVFVILQILKFWVFVFLV